jgi:streptogramin lyase
MDIGRSLQAALLFSVLPIALGACAGGSSAFAPHAAAPIPTASRLPTASSQANVSFTIRIPSAASAAHRRRPDYVSMGTNSISVTVAPAATSASPSPSPPTVLNCTSGQTCTVSLTAPVGSDMFSVTLYQGTNASGAVLGIGKATQSIVIDTANQVLVTLDGVVNSVSLAVTPTTLPAGTSATETVSVNALDAAGYTIVAPGGYVDANDAPLTISVAKTDYGNGKGVTSGPASGSLAYTYNGSDIDETVYKTTTSTAIAGSQGEADVTYVPTFIKSFPDATGADTNFITNGGDGNLWFTDFATGVIGSIVPSTGAITHYTIATSATNGSAEPEGIALGPNATLYFAEYNSNAIGSISTTTAATTGALTPVTETPLTTNNANPRGVAYDATCDANVWFTEFNGNKIGVLSTTTMTVTEYTVPTTAAQPDQIACGPDGNFWFTEYAGNKIGTITPAGVITEYPLSSGNPHGPIGIAKGADGSMWVAEAVGNNIARVVTSKTKPAAGTVGSVTEYPLPTIVSPGGTSQYPAIITPAPDGDLFFSEFNSENQTQNAMIGRITTTSAVAPNQAAGVLTAYPLANASNMPFGITIGPDGHVWYVDMGAAAIGYLIY